MEQQHTCITEVSYSSTAVTELQDPLNLFWVARIHNDDVHFTQADLIKPEAKVHHLTSYLIPTQSSSSGSTVYLTASPRNAVV